MTRDDPPSAVVDVPRRRVRPRAIRWSLAPAVALLALTGVAGTSRGAGDDAVGGARDGAADRFATAVRRSAPPQRATFAFTGDILTHRPVNHAAFRADGSYDYAPMFARVGALLSWADVAVCHLEQPVAPPGTPVIVGPAIHSSAASIATALHGAGYDRCSTASNHSLDRGVAGIDATVGALAAAGVGQSGMARSPAEAVPDLFDVGGITTAHLAYSYALGGVLPPGEEWRANRTDPAAIVAAARDARARGAELVIVSMHWGASAQSAPTAEQRSIARAIAGDVDLVVGHHAHVLQPIERVGDTWVVWGLGNLVSNLPVGSWPPSTQDGAIVTVDVVRTSASAVSVQRPRVYPTWCDRAAGFVVRSTAERNDPSVPAATRQALTASHARTATVLGQFLGPD